MKTTLYFLIMLFAASNLIAQSKTIDKFREANKEDMGLFFYASTLQMLDTEENQEFYNMVKGIEKMRFLSYKIGENGVDSKVFNDLKKDIKSERFEELMIVNHEGKQVIVYGRVKKGISEGAVALIEADESLNIVDIVGTIDIKNIFKIIDKVEKID